MLTGVLPPLPRAVHITTGPLFILTWPLFAVGGGAQYWAASVPALNAIKLVAIGTGAVKDEGAVRSVSREGDPGELLKGPLVYCLTMVAATAITWRSDPVGIVALSMMCGGDGFADIVGRRLGSKESLKIPYNPDKSVPGSAALVLAGTAFAYGLLSYMRGLGYLEMDVEAALPALLAVGAVGAAVESAPGGIDDNLTVPVATWAASSIILSRGALV